MVEVKDNPHGMDNTNSQIKFKVTMLKSNLWDYSNTHILVLGTITVVGQGADATAIANKNTNDR